MHVMTQMLKKDPPKRLNRSRKRAISRRKNKISEHTDGGTRPVESSKAEKESRLRDAIQNETLNVGALVMLCSALLKTEMAERCDEAAELLEVNLLLKVQINKGQLMAGLKRLPRRLMSAILNTRAFYTNQFIVDSTDKAGK